METAREGLGIGTGFKKALAESQGDERDGQQHMRHRERAQRHLRGCRERGDVERSGVLARALDEPLDVQAAAPQSACPVREEPLGQARGGGEPAPSTTDSSIAPVCANPPTSSGKCAPAEREDASSASRRRTARGCTRARARRRGPRTAAGRGRSSGRPRARSPRRRRARRRLRRPGPRRGGGCRAAGRSARPGSARRCRRRARMPPVSRPDAPRRRARRAPRRARRRRGARRCRAGAAA